MTITDMETKLVRFPIDNKNILEDFTEVFHHEDCVEFRHKGLVKQAFYFQGLLCEVSYLFGSAKFFVVCTEKVSDELLAEIKSEFKTRIEGFNDEDNSVRMEIEELENGYSAVFKYIVS